MSNIQIPEDVFIDLWYYFCFDDPEDHPSDRTERIRSALNEKMKKCIDRDLYTKSKNKNLSPEEREKARQEYLDRKGIPKSFRW